MDGLHEARDRFTDYTLVCQGREFKVQRFVLHVQSKGFAAALAGSVKDGKMEIKDTEADVLQAMLDWMYTFDYDPPESASKLVFHLKVYELANRYGAARLVGASLEHFEMECEGDEWWIPELAQAVRFLENDNKKDMMGHARLRGILLATVKSKLTQLVYSDEFADLVSEFKVLNVDLLRTMAVDALLRYPPAQPVMPMPHPGSDTQEVLAELAQTRARMGPRPTVGGGGPSRGGGHGRGALRGGEDGGLGMP